ncbi:MAG: tRNA1(Val) (adenine(37)-N6)-methyltransferase [Geobacter sp.]|nr:tRNA1(Val) (adenine(37)-N6)-methyltransferase [Geobacter sp.]
MKGEETIDELRRCGLRLIQPRDGYRFSLDPLLLCDFASGRTAETAIDLGTGCGVMPLVLARRYGIGRAVGVESHHPMAALAERNVVLNSLEGSVAIVADDILHMRRRFPVSSFDLVVSNPPYRRPGTGRVSPRPGRDLARHESTAGLADFLAAAKYLVRPGGNICFIYHPSRLDEFMACCRELKLAPVRLRMVHGTIAAEARMFLVELVKGRKGELTVEPPLIIYGDDGGYGAEAEEILGG